MEFFSWRTNSWMNRLHVALNSKQEVELKVELLKGAWEEEKKKTPLSVAVESMWSEVSFVFFNLSNL